MQFDFLDRVRRSSAQAIRRDGEPFRSMPQIGDVVPDFEAETTQGSLSFYDWAGDDWVFLFSHPAAFTAVCTTEMIALAANLSDFHERRVKPLGVCGSSLGDQRRWHKDMQSCFGADIVFPMIADPQLTLSKRFGMVHFAESCERAIRKTLLVGPNKKIRLISETPALVGRNTADILRQIDAVQAAEIYKVGIPANWEKGHDGVVQGQEHDGRPAERSGSSRVERWYMRFVPLN